MNIAIVEDEEEERKLLRSYLERYSKENGVSFVVDEFPNAIIFLENYNAKYDIVFMDIEMPHMNGMEAAERLRKIDDTCTLLFVTNMVKYAVNGYAVNALSFMVKPVKYAAFVMQMRRAVKDVMMRKNDVVAFKTVDGIRRISASDILFAEVNRHTVFIHTASNTFKVYGSLSEFMEKVGAWHFLKCNVCYVVNPKHITLISGDTVTVGEDIKLKISRPRKKEFLEQLADFFENTDGGRK